MMKTVSYAIGDEVKVIAAFPLHALTIAVVTSVTFDRNGWPRYHLDGSPTAYFLAEQLLLVRRATEVTLEVALRLRLGSGPSVATIAYASAVRLSVGVTHG